VAKKTDVEVAMEQAEQAEKVRGPQEVEVRELEPEEQQAVDEWYQQKPVTEPSDKQDFARSDQDPSFVVATGGVDLSAIDAPVIDPESGETLPADSKEAASVKASAAKK
jgi:hypothetical protein